MVNSVQPVGKRSEPTRIEPANDRAPLASNQTSGPAAPPPLAAPATIVQLSDAVFARQRGVMPGRARHDDRGDRWISSDSEAHAEADGLGSTLRRNPALAQQAQASVPVERVFALLFD